MIAECIHWLGLFRCRPWRFSTWIPKHCSFGHMVNWSLLPDWLHGQLAGVWRESLLYHCWTHPQSPCIWRGYDVHRQSVHDLLQHLCISHNLWWGIWNHDREENYGPANQAVCPRVGHTPPVEQPPIVTWPFGSSHSSIPQSSSCASTTTATAPCLLIQRMGWLSQSHLDIPLWWPPQSLLLVHCVPWFLV